MTHEEIIVAEIRRHLVIAAQLARPLPGTNVAHLILVALDAADALGEP